VLGVVKFALVVGFYMHLKFDNKLFTWLFLGGLTAAVATMIGLWALAADRARRTGTRARTLSRTRRPGA